MLRNIQPQAYQRKARTELEDIKHNLRLLNHITQELNSLAQGIQGPERQVMLDKSERLKIDIRQKMKSMGLNINEIICVLDYKITILTKQLSKIQKNTKNCPSSQVQKKVSLKAQEQYNYQINQLEERIFQLQKKQNQYVKEISQLKEKNAKLRDQFTSLSFDSNQRIKELSEKLHNNTSPNLTIRKANISNNLQTSYFINSQENEKKRIKNNFVKIKGANNFQHDLSPLQTSPADGKKNKNMLDSLTSQSSEYDIKGIGYQIPEFEQNSGNLKFGCFPGKQVSQKTKTGSSSENKKLNFEQNCQKSRRFEFLLNNLMDKNNGDSQDVNCQKAPTGFQATNGYQTTGNCKSTGIYQPTNGYQYNPMIKTPVEEYKSVFAQKNSVKRFQI